jgi:MFS family permease
MRASNRLNLSQSRVESRTARARSLFLFCSFVSRFRNKADITQRTRHHPLDFLLLLLLLLLYTSCPGSMSPSKNKEDYDQLPIVDEPAQPQEEDDHDFLKVDEEIDIVTTAEAITVDDAIERLGMGIFQFRVLFAAGLCFAADAMQVLLLSFLSVVLKEEWGLTDDETASITSVLFAGAMVGTLILGPLADEKGRKPSFMVAASVIAFFGIAVGFVTNYWSLLAMYFMVGFGVGGLTVPFDILAEFLPSASRGKYLLLIEYFWSVGVLLVVVFAYFTLGGQSGIVNWRLFVMLCSLPCCLSVVLGWLFVPESPRWLCTQGRCDEALDKLRIAAKANGCDVGFVFPETLELVPEEKENSNFCDLFSPKWRWTILKLWGAWAFFAFGYYGTIEVVTSIFASQHDASPDGEAGTYYFDYGAIFVSSSAELVGTTFVILLVDTAGRIPLQIVSFTMAGISVCALCVLASHGYPRHVLIAFAFAARIFEMAGSCVTWVSTAEILTTEVRTTGHSSANAIARIGALLSPFLVQGNVPLVQMGFIMLVVHACTVLFVSTLPETKGSHMGATTEEEADDEVSFEMGQGGHIKSEVSSASDRLII